MLPMLHSQVNDAEVTSEVLYMAVLYLFKKKKKKTELMTKALTDLNN